MKTPIVLIAFVAAVSVKAGDFVNLTFNQPDLSRLHTGALGAAVAPVGDLLRGWDVALRPAGGEWNSFREEIAFVIHGGNIPPIALNKGMHSDQADLSVWFNTQAAIGVPGFPDPPEVRLSTKGMVPENAMTFDWYHGTSLELTITDGFRTMTKEMGQTSMNVSGFAGKEVTISFLQRIGGSGAVDVIGFTLVPEPETWALLGVGLVGLFAWRHKRA